MKEGHAAVRVPDRRCRHALWLLVLAWNAAVGQEAEGFEPQPRPVQALDSYGLVVEHLCGDTEYLSCLAVSERECKQEMQADPLRRCRQDGDVLLRFQSAQPAMSVPPGLVECVYVAHVALRQLDASAVNQCMTEAKLREPSIDEPAVRHDQPDR